MSLTKIISTAKNAALKVGVDVRYDEYGNPVLTSLKGVEVPAYTELHMAVRDTGKALGMVTTVRPGAKRGPSIGIGAATFGREGEGFD